MDVGFGEALLYSGALLAVAAALSGLMHGTVLSISVLSVAAGLILAEAGPHAFGSLLEGGVVDELFLTLSPLLVGDAGPDSRLRLVEAADLVPPSRLRLLSLRRHEEHLFLRYELNRSGA